MACALLSPVIRALHSPVFGLSRLEHSYDIRIVLLFLLMLPIGSLKSGLASGTLAGVILTRNGHERRSRGHCFIYTPSLEIGEDPNDPLREDSEGSFGILDIPHVDHLVVYVEPKPHRVPNIGGDFGLHLVHREAMQL